VSEALSTGLEPVTIEQVRGCHFKAKPCALCGLPKSNRAHTPKKSATCPGSWPRGCERCGANKSDPVHFGAPSSFNVWSGQGDNGAMAYKGEKDKWQSILLNLLRASDLPTGLGGVYVEGEITFPEFREDRDQGNFRVMVEKALGDALQDGGYITNDNWTRYEFGQLSMRIAPGESATRLTIFPRWDERGPTVDQQRMELA
jgi:hypothetical protein